MTEAKTAAEKLAALVPAPSAAAAPVTTSDEPMKLPPPTDPAPPPQTMDLDEPTPRRRGTTRKKTPANGATTAAATREVQKLLPSSVRVHVKKRDSDGSMAFINDYSANDLQAQGSIERFLLKYVVPNYGYGDFSLYMQRPGKDLEPVGTVKIQEPFGHIPGGAAQKSETKELLELFLTREGQSRDAAAKQKDPLQQMQETMTFLETFRAGGDKEKSSMDPMQMMLMMQMMKPAPQGPQGPDPIMLKIIDRLDRMEDQQNMAAMMPPPPPPPPPPSDGADGFAVIMQAMMQSQQSQTAMLVEVMRSKTPDRDPVQDLAALTRLTGANDDRMTTKDFLAMLPTLKDMIAPNQERSGLSEAMETLRSVKLLEREFGGAPENPSANSFWEFLREFVQSDAGTRIAEAITAAESSKKIDARHAERRQAAQSVDDPEEPKGLEIPESFRTKNAVEINTAATPQERLKALVTGMQSLAAYPDFRPYMAKIIGLMKENRKLEALEFIAQFLEALIAADALEQEPCEKVLEDMRTYWPLVRQQLKFPDIEEVFPEGYSPDGAEPNAGIEEAVVEPEAPVEVADEEEYEVDRPSQTYRDRDPRDAAPEPESQPEPEPQPEPQPEPLAATA
jgi:hypothetical protein